MAEDRESMEVNPQQVDKKTVIFATVAGIAIGGPILGLMGFSLLSSLTLLVVTSPLLLLFSPLLLGAASVLAVTLAGFVMAGIMGALGLSSFVLVYRSIIKGRKISGDQYSGEEEQYDNEVAGTGDGTEADDQALKQQQQDSSISDPVTVDRMVELFESLKEPHENDTTAVHIVTVEVDDDDEVELEQQHNKDRASGGGYLQQNVQREIPQET
ncbi:oleosin S1-2 [Capsicum galapagoense]